VNQESPQGEVHVRPAADVDMRQRPRDVQHAPGMDVEPELAQQPAEVQQVAQDGAHLPTLARFKSSDTRSPRTAWMSS
jgi:hypothetical protein